MALHCGNSYSTLSTGYTSKLGKMVFFNSAGTAEDAEPCSRPETPVSTYKRRPNTITNTITLSMLQIRSSNLSKGDSITTIYLLR
jgi:hypothetical protein